MEHVPWGVLWEEGLFLQPHHFQQFVLGLGASARLRLEMSLPHRWGVSSVEIDPLQLEQGRVDVRHLEALLPSGEPLVFHGTAPGNARIEPREVPKTDQDRLRVHAGVRRVREHEPNVADEGSDPFDPPRYERASGTVADLVTGRNLVDVHFQRLNVRLFFEGERMDGFETVPIAEITAPAVGLPLTRVSPNFVPPCLRVAASDVLRNWMEQVYRESAGKANELGGAASVAEIENGTATPAEHVQFLKLLVLRGSLAALREAAESAHVHPSEAYMMLASLLGQFSALCTGAGSPTVPPYDHHAIGPCFEAAAGSLLKLLRADQLAANYRKLDLRRGTLPFAGIAMGVQGLDAEWLRGRTTFYLAFSNPDPGGRDLDWYQCGNLKIASASRIGEVVGQKRFGVGAVLCQKPRALPARAGAQYYKLETRGALRPELQAEWEAVNRERSLVVHFAPGGYLPVQQVPELGLEAYVVFDR
jgi:type VI secretion system protein ImpJ